MICMLYSTVDGSEVCWYNCSPKLLVQIYDASRFIVFVVSVLAFLYGDQC